ncbi:hypothetical protein HanRHA438_Chr17g0817371 [Helianthus annuus]|nr:hypothetical protein HanIR_Chr17g0876421 [Helianthus annuus]KAJ0826713.1 hypothetical protein HanRHA438_Chr17g0817371 [Helianthus annuus]
MSPILLGILPVNRLLERFKNLNPTSFVISLGITPCKSLLERSKYVTRPRMLPYPYTLPIITNQALPINSCFASPTIGFRVTFPVMTLKLLKQVGILPERLLSARSSIWIESSLHISSGISPVSLFERRLRCFKIVASPPADIGMPPTKLFAERSRICKLFKFIRFIGSSPESLLLCMFNDSNEDKFAKDLGNSPVRLLFGKYKIFKNSQFVQQSGRTPERLVFPRCIYIICLGSTSFLGQRKSFGDTDERLLSEIFRYCRPENVLQNQLGMLSEIWVLPRYKTDKLV